MNKLAAILLVSFVGFSAHAMQGAYFGINTTSLDNDTVSFDSEMGFEVGYTKHYDFGMPFLVRTGAGYVQHNGSFEFLGSKIEYDVGYIEVPVTALYAFNEMFSGFAGINFDIQITDDCTVAGGTCTIDDLESFIMTLPIGAHIKFSDMHAAEVTYELGLGEVADEVDLKSSIGARYVYMF